PPRLPNPFPYTTLFRSRSEGPYSNPFAQIAYDYTRDHTSAEFAAWMRTLPTERRVTIEGIDLHLVHGSPLGLNDFFWESLADGEDRKSTRLHSSHDQIS